MPTGKETNKAITWGKGMPENKWAATSKQKMPCHKMQQKAWKTKLKTKQGISHPRHLNEILMA